MPELRTSAPGRVCLFGEHQDYLGLPVIAAAVNLRIGVEADPVPGDAIEVHMPDVGARTVLHPNAPQVYEGPRDYLRSCITVLQRLGCTWSQGYRVTMRGDIPINAGVSSSSAMVVMWLQFMLCASDAPPAAGAEDLARLGHAAEVLEFDEPGGMMDHFCAALGGVLHINTVAPFAATRLPATLAGFVLGNSLQPKATIETLRSTRADVVEGIRLLSEVMPEFSLAGTAIEEAGPMLLRLPPRPARRLRANLVNRDLTLAAGPALAEGDDAALGRLLSEHHAQLRDGLDLSTPKIERMLNAALAAGALGGKVNGSGGGGCMFAYAPGREEAVAEAVLAEGGDATIVSVDDGVRIG